jgi:hypothetical protein
MAASWASGAVGEVLLRDAARSLKSSILIVALLFSGDLPIS